MRQSRCGATTSLRAPRRSSRFVTSAGTRPNLSEFPQRAVPVVGQFEFPSLAATGRVAADQIHACHPRCGRRANQPSFHTAAADGVPRPARRTARALDSLSGGEVHDQTNFSWPAAGFIAYPETLSPIRLDEAACYLLPPVPGTTVRTAKLKATLSLIYYMTSQPARLSRCEFGTSAHQPTESFSRIARSPCQFGDTDAVV